MKARFNALALLVALFALLISPAQALQNDDRVDSVVYREGATVPVSSAVGHGIVIMFAPGERVVAFDVVDPDAFTIEESVNTGSLIIRTNKAPVNPMITVQTQLRNYSFSINPGSPDDAKMVVQFSYEPDGMSAGSEQTFEVRRPQYRITGEIALRPTQISDDGRRTFLIWAEDQALPAVFAINPFGKEEIVDGYMRAGIYTIDRVYPKLVFRIDRKAAKAERLSREEGRR